jgi:hypothetical protein
VARQRRWSARFLDEIYVLSTSSYVVATLFCSSEIIPFKSRISHTKCCATGYFGCDSRLLAGRVLLGTLGR